MAITFSSFPYGWSVRNQKLMVIAASTDSGASGFKYGVTVTDNSNGKIYNFLCDKSPQDDRLYFDLAPLVYLRNFEPEIDLHDIPCDAFQPEPEGNGFRIYNVRVSGWWLQAGVLTEMDEGYDSDVLVVNGYYQIVDGYRPNPETRFALANNQSLVMNDLTTETHTWYYKDSMPFAAVAGKIVAIPCFLTDYGVFTTPWDGKTNLTTTAAEILEFVLYTGDVDTYTTHSWTYDPATASPNNLIIHVGVYPGNLAAAGDPNVEPPANYSDWMFYTVQYKTKSGLPKSRKYVFYNAERYGQSDCNHDRVRLGWIGSKAGWNYWNFIKKNEYTNQIDRKRFERTVFDGTGNVHDTNRRTLVDRPTLVERTLSVTSDWVQEAEFEYLRSLFVSNQVSLITDTGGNIPCSVEDAQFLERRGRNGKLVNVTFTVKIAQPYWS